jgi:hypothetical protein
MASTYFSASIPDVRGLATSSSTVTEVHDDALISTTPRDAARSDRDGLSP